MAVYDCFTFFNEYDLLKLRLQMYYRHVDYFVISECCRTQQGKSKSYNYLEHKSFYKQWEDKIIYLQADDPPELKNKEDWAIENYQRNYLTKGLKNCKPDDFVFISDLDEFYPPDIIAESALYIVKPYNKAVGRKKTIIQIKEIIGKNPLYLLPDRKLSDILEKMPVSFEQYYFYYFMNYRWNDFWHGTVLVKYKNLTSPQDLRNKRNFIPYVTSSQRPAGWHFSYLGGKEQIKRKISSIIEGGQMKNGVINIDAYIEDCLQNRKDLFGREENKLELVVDTDIGLPDIEMIKKNYPQFLY
jgi:beta-1,4-mannosyl-glycoprotein beta-1,4-N-acetylglucosaminyltransferase